MLVLAFLSDLQGAIPSRRTGPTPAYSSEIRASGESFRGCVHRITQHADSGDGDFDRIARDQRADARRRAGGDAVAWQQRPHARNPAEQNGRGTTQAAGLAGL